MSFPAAHDCCSELFSILACPFPIKAMAIRLQLLLYRPISLDCLTALRLRPERLALEGCAGTRA